MNHFLILMLFLCVAGVYARTWYVNVSNPHASDTGDGTSTQPFKSISPAALKAQPGDTVLVGGGVYRERVAPARGGTLDNPITYMAAPGEEVIIKASEILKWEKVEGGNGTFKTTLSNSLFDTLDGTPNGTLYNPYLNPLQRGYGCTAYTTGQVYADGHPLIELPDKLNVSHSIGCWVPHKRNGHPTKYTHTPNGCFAMFSNGTALMARWPDNYNGTVPSNIEVTVRSRVFAPHLRGLTHIVVQGFIMEHAANQWIANFWDPKNWKYAQSGILGTRSGYMWTIRNNTLRKAKTIGLDIGIEGGYRPKGGGDNEGTNQPIPNITGKHIVEHNIIELNGASGIQGYVASGSVSFNIIQDNGALGCAGAENAAVKTHNFEGTFEGNVIRRNSELPIWFDSGFNNMRFTRNVVIVPANQSSDGVVFELADGPALVDNNIIVGSALPSWNQKWTPHGKTRPGGTGIGVQDASNVTVAHNLIVDFTGGPALDLHGLTSRKINGHTSAMRGWWIGANMMFATIWCPWVHLHDEKHSGDVPELIYNETIQHNLFTGDKPWYPSQTNLSIVVKQNVNATAGFSIGVHASDMVLTLKVGSVLGQSGCLIGGPGGDIDFTGASRSKTKCIPGPIDGLQQDQPRNISLWPQDHRKVNMI